jgi:hypothetical protein
MWNRMRVRCLLVALGASCAAFAAIPEAQPAPEGPLVDYRMTALEQARRIHAVMSERQDRGATMTVMRLRDDPAGDYHHIVLAPGQATPDNVREQLFRPGVDGVSWDEPRPLGACDSQRECEQKTNDLCENSGNGKVKPTTVRITTHTDGSKSCSGDCSANGAAAFVNCHPAACLLCF